MEEIHLVVDDLGPEGDYVLGVYAKLENAERRRDAEIAGTLAAVRTLRVEDATDWRPLSELPDVDLANGQRGIRVLVSDYRQIWIADDCGRWRGEVIGSVSHLSGPMTASRI